MPWAASILLMTACLQNPDMSVTSFLIIQVSFDILFIGILSRFKLRREIPFGHWLALLISIIAVLFKEFLHFHSEDSTQIEFSITQFSKTWYSIILCMFSRILYIYASVTSKKYVLLAN